MRESVEDPGGELRVLHCVADRQSVLSYTANSLKARTTVARNLCFVLAVFGAILASLVSGLDCPDIRPYLAWPATTMLAIGAFVAARLLSKESVSLHVDARAASEALKRESYLYVVQSSEYQDVNSRGDKLQAVLTRINANVEHLARHERANSGIGSCPRKEIDLQDYIENRARKQIQYYRRRAKSMGRTSTFLHSSEFVLTGIAAVVTALAVLFPPSGFEVASVTAVVTTIAATFVAHLESTRYDDQIATYRITSNRLEAYLAGVNESTGLADVAENVERILAEETKSWQALWLNVNERG